MRFGQCKFGSNCSLHHPHDVSQNEDIEKDVIKLKDNFTSVFLSLKAKENEIKDLEARLTKLERKPHIKTVKCDVCGYKAISMISFKTRMNEVHEIETLRHSDKN